MAPQTAPVRKAQYYVGISTLGQALATLSVSKSGSE